MLTRPHVDPLVQSSMETDDMIERTTQTTVIFNHPSRLQGVDHPLAPGAYVVETDEEIIPGLSFVAYRRLRTSIILPFDTGASAGRQVSEIDPDDLAAALARDIAVNENSVGTK
jgi:hypothetical protein